MSVTSLEEVCEFAAVVLDNSKELTITDKLLKRSYAPVLNQVILIETCGCKKLKLVPVKQQRREIVFAVYRAHGCTIAVSPHVHNNAGNQNYLAGCI